MADQGADTDTRRRHWDAVYAGKREDEVSWFQASPEPSLSLIGRSVAGKTARIIDVGGGASRLVDHLLAEGFDALTVLDIAGSALAQARSRLGDAAEAVRWVEADVTRWRPDQRYDLWHDRAVFHFLTEPADRARYTAVMHRALKPGGVAIIGTFALDGPERCSGLAVVRYAPEMLAVELGPDFELLESVHQEHRTPAGKTQSFQFSRLRYRPG